MNLTLIVFISDLANTFSLLSIIFEGLESLLSPFSWQHSLIPALPTSHLSILEAPTPYVIGLINNSPSLEAEQSEKVEEAARWEDIWRSTVMEIVGKDPECLVLEVTG